MNKTNIYGDIKLCIKCKNPADVIEKGKQLGLPGVIHLQKTGLGGKLNPNFVEFLMGYPMNWTKIEPTE